MLLLLVLSAIVHEICSSAVSGNCDNIPHDTHLVHRAGDGGYGIHIFLLPPGQNHLRNSRKRGIFWPISLSRPTNSSSSTERYRPPSHYIPEREYEIVVAPKVTLAQYDEFQLEAVYLTAVPSGTPQNQETQNSLGNFTPTFCSSSNVGAVEIMYNFPRQVTFIWKAPKPKVLEKVSLNDASISESGHCLEIRATVVPWDWHRIYFRNAASLKHTLCQERDPRQIERWPNYVEKFDLPPKSGRKQDGIRTRSIQSDGNPGDTVISSLYDDSGLYDAEESGSCSVQELPKPVRRCCACNTAVYRLVIQSDWQQQQHWRDWPAAETSPDGQITSPHWSEILGASHSTLYDVFHAGGFASPAVDALCTTGDVSKLEGEFRNQAGENILTVIRTRGIDSAAPPKQRIRSALFAVNSTHHLISFLTRLVPSTDWCTGLSRVDVCLPNCSWPLRMQFRLEPWDAGVMSGNTYVPTEPSERLREPKPMCPITPDLRPNTPFTVQTDYVPVQPLTTSNNGAPEFVDFTAGGSDQSSAKVKNTFNAPRKTLLFHKPRRVLHSSTTRVRRTFAPLGSVELELLRVNEHEDCSVEPDQEDQAFGQTSLNKEAGLEVETSTEDCHLSSWTAWGPCMKVDPSSCSSPQARSYWSSKAPKTMRTRMILSSSTVTSCTGLSLKEEKTCHPVTVKLRCVSEPHKLSVLSNEACQSLPWGPWSRCLNATCSHPGVIYRWRQFPNHLPRQTCEMYSQVSQVDTCWPPPDKPCHPNELKKACTENPPSAEKLCPTVQNTSTRYFYNPQNQRCDQFKYVPSCHLQALMTHHEMGYIRNVFSDRSRCEEVCIVGFDGSPEPGKSTTKRKSNPCWESLDVGHFCSSNKASAKWHFDKNKKECIEFMYLGCGGNENRYDLREQCENECKLKTGSDASLHGNTRGSSISTGAGRSGRIGNGL